MVLLLSILVFGFFIFVVYKPMYKVSLSGEDIGYTENKSELQKRINEYIKNGDSKTVAFVEVDTMPVYKMCLTKKGLVTNDDEVFDKVISSGIPYYKYYAILEDNEEKYYVLNYEECEKVLADLKEKKSMNSDKVTYVLKYETELKELSAVDAIVTALYKEPPKVKKTSSVSTMKNVDYSNTKLGVSLIRPVNGTITSRFGPRSRGVHTGLDIANSSGTPIKAAASGVCVFSAYKGSYGNMIVIDHGGGVQTYYAHCSRLYVSVGSNVNQGDVIAAIGSTGNSTGPHLHFEVRVNGVAKNPQNYVY